MILTTSRGLLLTKTKPADSIATSVPPPIAIPTSARVSAGASLTPSPTIATRFPCDCNSATFYLCVQAGLPQRHGQCPILWRPLLQRGDCHLLTWQPARPFDAGVVQLVCSECGSHPPQRMPQRLVCQQLEKRRIELFLP